MEKKKKKKKAEKEKSIFDCSDFSITKTNKQKEFIGT